MSGYGPPRGWRGSNAWADAPSQRPTGGAVSGDYVAAVDAFCDEWLKQNAGCDLIDHGFGADHGGELTVTKLRAVLDELKQLRQCGNVYHLYDDDPLICTLDRGHPGDHTAPGAEWPQGHQHGDRAVARSPQAAVQEVDVRTVDNAIGLLKSAKSQLPVDAYNAMCLLVGQFGGRIEAMDAELAQRGVAVSD